MPSSRTPGTPAFDIKQVTYDSFGHCINSTQCFSPDGKRIVYDTRNDDAQLAANARVRMVDLETGADTLLYETTNQSVYGPGVGAATFSPDGKTVLFLGGIQNASPGKPYAFTRRTGIGIVLDKPCLPIWMDGRDIQFPFTPGALRGGTHAHTWSGDGSMISFTYNDHILAEEIKTDPSVIDTRTVGIMFPRKVHVAGADDIENKNGECFAVLVTAVTKTPRPGSDQVSRAFDECWIGTDGYINAEGKRQKKAIAFQGHVTDRDGQLITAIFVVDIPQDTKSLTKDVNAGDMKTLPSIPSTIHQRRISGDEINVSAVPRHWLRTTPDGSTIGFLQEDAKGIVQLWGISPNGGRARQLTFLPASISGPFNFSFDGKYAAFISGGAVCITRLSDGVSFTATNPKENPDLIGAVVWSPTEYVLTFNGYVHQQHGRFLQIFRLTMLE